MLGEGGGERDDHRGVKSWKRKGEHGHGEKSEGKPGKKEKGREIWIKDAAG